MKRRKTVPTVSINTNGQQQHTIETLTIRAVANDRFSTSTMIQHKQSRLCVLQYRIISASEEPSASLFGGSLLRLLRSVLLFLQEHPCASTTPSRRTLEKANEIKIGTDTWAMVRGFALPGKRLAAHPQMDGLSRSPPSHSPWDRVCGA